MNVTYKKEKWETMQNKFKISRKNSAYIGRPRESL